MFKLIAEKLQQLESLLGSAEMIRVSKRVAAAACSACSFLTSLFGALQYFTASGPLAFLLCIGLQLGLLGFSHGTPDRKTRRALTLLGWLICFGFSIYLSALGFYRVQFASVRAAREGEGARQQWTATVKDLRRVQGEARGWLKDAAARKGAEVEREQRRVDWRRSHRVPFSEAGLARLRKEQSDLGAVRARFDGLALEEVSPEDAAAARQRLGQIYAQVTTAYDAMPQEFRAAHGEPAQQAEAEAVGEIQSSFFDELRRGTKPVWIALVIAMLLDVVPVLLLQSNKTARSRAERIRERRLAREEVRLARAEDVRLYTPSLRVRVEGDAAYEGVLVFGGDERVLYPEDLTANLGELERTLSASAGTPLRVTSVSTGEGLELIPGMSLASQLGPERVVRVRAEYAVAEVA